MSTTPMVVGLPEDWRHRNVGFRPLGFILELIFFVYTCLLGKNHCGRIAADAAFAPTESTFLKHENLAHDHPRDWPPL